MGFLEQSQRVLDEVYRTFGFQSLYSDGVSTYDVTLIQDKSYVVEQADMLVYKVRSSELDRVGSGATLTIDGVVKDILMHQSSEDALEILIGVRR